jgi:cyclic pyranopterin phosphate synthase
VTIPIPDTLGRPLSSLRLSVTDRCNLRCAYCMPEEEYGWLPRTDILSFEEFARLVDVFVLLGVTKLRLTGGEPLLRRDLASLVAMLARKPAIEDLALTTNGLLLADCAADLARAGLRRVTVSLDTLRRERFVELTRRNGLDQVLAGIDAAAPAGFRSIKLDTVVMRGVNDDEIVPLLEYAKRQGAEIRFIEYMDVGGATRWSMDRVVTRAQILACLEDAYGPIHPLHEETSAPAERFMLADGTVFGIIASTTAPFCRACDRSRLTADGLWYTCLYATHGTDLRAPLRRGDSTEEIAQLLEQTWRARTDRGAEERLAHGRREPLVQITDLRRDPHLEMHTRGG